jgi:hypothetical protein
MKGSLLIDTQDHSCVSLLIMPSFVGVVMLKYMALNDGIMGHLYAKDDQDALDHPWHIHIVEFKWCKAS